MTDKEPIDNEPSPQPLDLWSEFVVKNNQLFTTIMNGMFDLGVVWLKLVFNQWLVDYYRDLYKKDRKNKGYSNY